MTEPSHFKINVTESVLGSTVQLNGVELQGVTRVSFDLDAQRPELSRLRLEIIGTAEVEGEFVERVIAGTPIPEEQGLTSSTSSPP